MMNKTPCIALAALSAALCCAQAAAQDFDPAKTLTGDWGGTRTRLVDSGVDLRLSYTGEFAHNNVGGSRDDTYAYADQFFLAGSFDLDKLWAWRGATFKVEVANRNGDSLNDAAGFPTLLAVQEIHGRGAVTRLSQFSLTQELFDDRLSIKLGRLYANGDFFSFSCKFQNLSFCGGLPGYVSNGWYVDPISQYGAVVAFKPNDAWRFKLGAYDVNPNNLDRDQGLKLRTDGDSQGTLVVAEIEYLPTFGDGLQGHYRVGGWRNSADYRNTVTVSGLPSDVSAAAAATMDSESGYYATAEQVLWHGPGGGTLRLFGNWVQADKDTDRIDQMLQLGAWLDAPFASRPDDRIGFAAGRTRISERLGDAQRRYNVALPAGAAAVGVQGYEYPLELNYQYAITPALSLMPNLQYIRNANGIKDNNGVVGGLRVSMNF
ncbi:carbohydrate porin [Xanthomonas translucens pv. graminis]|jgi:porin|uniref:Regulator of pathogenicity factors n=2 Tax=Xanthomonas translucens group TaxID=3390202 RepID=A0A1M4IR20_9XANT|nr:carbohydrate porin [Xanthomonas translucens]EKU23548.1 carbohydrate-selective porin [Xanthomonas translucens pv. graminis ART-Xtg29]OAX60137.1 porin [Xanthomonas translucens pv. graminis]UKE54409.1 carbohydrate porin [Xanthomonas translucens pv. graminis]WIH08904.1 carbohydrate porin [Xanthomonas translucens pv. graminis]WIH12316.1 carbohydrate porin [Xanthomonas translucens pv. graminis]